MYMLVVLGFLCFLYHYCLVVIFFLEGELLCGNIVEDVAPLCWRREIVVYT